MCGYSDDSGSSRDLILLPSPATQPGKRPDSESPHQYTRLFPFDKASKEIVDVDTQK